MAIPATTIWEVETGGSDSANSGGFDPENASMATDGAATSATGASPVFSSASYSFSASDVGAWLFIKSGTNTRPGWYKIASVASNQATLSAAAGAGNLYATNNSTYRWVNLTTAAGIATTASPSSITWTVDYSQQASPRTTLSAATAAGAGSTLTDATIGKNWVGNTIQVTGGTNVTTGVFAVVSTSTTTATLDRAVTTGVTSNAAGGMGGAFASLGQASLKGVGGNNVFQKSGSYSITSASTNVAGGCVALTWATANTYRIARWEGYSTVRSDKCSGGSRPVNTASGISTAKLFEHSVGSGWVEIDSIDFDGASLTSIQGIRCNGNPCSLGARRMKLANFTNSAVSIGAATANFDRLEVTGCSTAIAMILGSSNSFPQTVRRSYIHDNTVSGIQICGSVQDSIVANNTGATSDGITLSSNYECKNVTVYGNGRDGIRMEHNNGVTVFYQASNVLAVNNGGLGINADAANIVVMVTNCATYNNTGGSIGTNIGRETENCITLSGDPFTNAASKDFSLNNTAGAGAACRAAGILGAFPAGTTTGYIDIGAAQHADSGGAGMLFVPDLAGT